MSMQGRSKPRETKTTKVKKKMPGYGLFAALVLATGISIATYLNFSSEPATALSDIVVYKSPTCGCCKKWVDHLRSNGFSVDVRERNNMQPIKQEEGIQPQHQSCHTAKIDGYFIEGHVPANDIKRLISEKPSIAGLAVPGMPMGSPGMEGHRKDSYSVLAVDAKNSTTVFAQY